METKNELVRRLVSQEEYKRALQICKDWDRGIAPEDREQLRLGYECLLYPRIYSQLGHDTNFEYQKAIEVLLKLYGK